MDVRERRKLEGRPSPGLKRELNEDQRIALADLEKFGWELKFIRRPMFQQPIPVVASVCPAECRRKTVAARGCRVA